MKIFESFKEIYEKDIDEDEAIFDDYPKAASKNAQWALDMREEHGRDVVDGGTRVGWQRANQLANNEKISFDVVKRMKAFFDRHEKNKKINPKYKDEKYRDRGFLSHMLWGGDEAYEWAKNKIKEIE